MEMDSTNFCTAISSKLPSLYHFDYYLFFKNPTNFLQNILQIAPILRYLDSIRYGLLSRKFGQIEKSPNIGSEKEKEAREQRIKYYTLVKMILKMFYSDSINHLSCFKEAICKIRQNVKNDF